MTPDFDRAFRETLRSHFVPAFFVPAPGRPGWIVRREPEAAWRAGVDGGGALVTQVDGVHADDVEPGAVVSGSPTSSSSAPSLMRLMLDALDLRPGHRVIEIGTGTGYNAAVITRLLGPGAVTSIDVDPALVARARARLHGLGLRPDLAVGDGTAGLPRRAPFDRVLATVAVDRVPPAWLTQVAPGGRLVVALDRGGGGGLLAALDADGHGRAVGRFLPDYGGFMPLRARSRGSAPRLPDPAAAPPRPTGLAAAEVGDPGAPVEFYVALRVGGLTPISVERADGGREDWFLRGGGWACLTAGEVRQGGPTRVWDDVENAHAEWVALGRPPRERFGISIERGEHTVWLDDPHGDHRWPLH